ncbi:YfcC family protein [Lutispora sp.]|uniref:YfcC family protein n=1 Tax=Lutispora sp. TaxID=2828727 RepID=UPI002B216CCD|nr:AbgT family transporter [Lutispora sp.]MEA4963094.1 AbgT family transporter [Lutispora sp.]
MVKNSKQKRPFPNMLVIVFIVIIVAALMTWIIPAGQYDKVVDKATGKTIVDPDSFKYIEKTPVNPFSMLLAIPKGLTGGAGITFLVFITFGAIAIIEKTGSIDAAMAASIRKMGKSQKSVYFVMTLIMIFFAAWSSTGTFSHSQVFPFIPMFVLLCNSMGFDALVAIGMTFTIIGTGYASGTINPYSIGVAHSVAGLPMFSGLRYRIVVLVVMSAVTIAYVLWYARKIKRDPSKSLLADIKLDSFSVDEERLNTEMTNPRKVSLFIFLLGILLLVYGLTKLKWGLDQISAIFLALGIIIGLINRMPLNTISNSFVEGLQRGALPAIIVGFGRASVVIFENGHIIDTIIHSVTSVLGKFNLYISSVIMLIFQTLLNFFIPSASGQAAVTMPILAPISDLIGMNRQITTLIFHFGDGYSNNLWPMLVLIACAIAKVPLEKYYKWYIPLFGILFVFQIIFVWIAIAINYGPF